MIVGLASVCVVYYMCTYICRYIPVYAYVHMQLLQLFGLAGVIKKPRAREGADLFRTIPEKYEKPTFTTAAVALPLTSLITFLRGFFSLSEKRSTPTRRPGRSDHILLY